MKDIFIHEINYNQIRNVEKGRYSNKAEVIFSLGKIINCNIEIPIKSASSTKDIIDYICKELEDVLGMRYVDEI